MKKNQHLSPVFVAVVLSIVSGSLPAAAQTRMVGAGSGTMVPVVPAFGGSIQTNANTLLNSPTPIAVSGLLAAPSAAPAPFASVAPTAATPEVAVPDNLGASVVGTPGAATYVPADKVPFDGAAEKSALGLSGAPATPTPVTSDTVQKLQVSRGSSKKGIAAPLGPLQFSSMSAADEARLRKALILEASQVKLAKVLQEVGTPVGLILASKVEALSPGVATVVRQYKCTIQAFDTGLAIATFEAVVDATSGKLLTLERVIPASKGIAAPLAPLQFSNMSAADEARLRKALISQASQVKLAKVLQGVGTPVGLILASKVEALSPGVATVVRQYKYTIQAFDTRLAIATFEAVVDATSGKLLTLERAQ